ncbi:MAG: transcription-repair coupling factor [Treponema sp.]|nr:transcription-repair coupling factor [Treponema sp.]
MENSLSTNSLIPILSSWKNFSSEVTRVSSAEDGSEIFPLDIHGLNGSLDIFFVAEYIRKRHFRSIHKMHYEQKMLHHQEDFLIVVARQKDADECESDLMTIMGDSVEVIKLPWWGTVPYRPTTKGSILFGMRAGVLSKLAVRNPSSEKPRVFVVPERALLTPVPPASYIRKLSFRLTVHQSINPVEMSERLSQMGYLRVPKVGMKGEFAVRGEVIDIFMPGESLPYRIIFEFDEIENIKTFDVESQTTKDSLKSVLIYPMKEVLWTEDLAKTLESVLDKAEKSGIVNNFADFDKNRHAINNGGEEIGEKKKSANLFDESLDEENERTPESAMLAFTEKALEEKDRIVAELMVNGETDGEELFYGLVWDRLYSILDYIDAGTTIFCREYERLVNAQSLIENEFLKAYRIARQTLPVMPPSLSLLNFNSLMEMKSRLVRFRCLVNDETIAVPESTEGSVARIKSESAISFLGNINYFKEELSARQNSGWWIYIFADNPSQAVRIGEVVKEFTEKDGDNIHPVHVFQFPLTEGFAVADEKLLVIQENEIFGRKKAGPKSIRKTKSKPLDTFMDLTPGDLVVHENFGIGLFKGIERIKSLGTERDFIKLEYADHEHVFIPIEQVNLIQKYIGGDSSHTALDRIGSKSWSARKAKVQKQVQEIAEKLIDLYSKRQASRGYAFPKDTEWQSAFEAAFPYEDTPDQYTATQDIKTDMERPIPMDRLVCGDVGYGKTEIALRAAFKSVMGGKQVAFLAPTTILAEQHYENALERFKNFPVRIAHLSRFVEPKEQKKIIQLLADGKIDILIGTHRIIQKDVVYKDLGLLIIDEEQRFGVRDKEKLKVLKTNVDCLTMSATPIPRTLHMSLLKIRDMSLLTTPPQNRQPIETVIEEFSDEKVAKAIRREVARNGQVFFLHNRVETLDDTRRKIENIVPEMLVDVAHGQMSSDELDDIFRRFKNGGFHVLVATTIIENGIDIPNVNTIIIDRADMYGISQLYQLRGRVGRSDRQAYAYLFYPENKSLSEIAMKRLQVISDFTELGSGFRIAMKDMEIRGAGNLLGRDQSGEVCAVGFEMYPSLLNSAIERLSSSDWKAPNEVLLELEYSGFIPDSFIEDAQTKMEMYKKIAMIRSDRELEEIHEELFDRFGPVPEEVNSLLNLAKIRMLCGRLGVVSLIEHNHLATITFEDVTRLSIDKLMNLVKLYPTSIRPNPKNPSQLFIQMESIDLKTKCEFIKEKLDRLL